jgi:inner membrane protein
VGELGFATLIHAGVAEAVLRYSPSVVDPLTHVLVGASLGYAACGWKMGRTAGWVGGLAAFIPDADVFIRSTADPLLAIEYHRHFTHALMFAPVGAAIVAGIGVVSRTHRSQFLLLWACATLAYLSHCLLDAATSYGTQLLWPFSNQRFGWDFISIIDPLFTLALGIALVWALVKRSARIAAAGLLLGVGYVGIGVVQHTRASAGQATLARSRGHDRERFEMMPTIANNLVRRSLYVHQGNIYSDRIRVGWFSGVTIREGTRLPLVRVGDLTPGEKTRNMNHSFERFSWFSEGWVARSPGDHSVLGDMRYSLSAEAFDPIWGIRFTPRESPVEVAWINRTRQRKIDPGELWREISGADLKYKPLDHFR